MRRDWVSQFGIQQGRYFGVRGVVGHSTYRQLVRAGAQRQLPPRQGDDPRVGGVLGTEHGGRLPAVRVQPRAVPGEPASGAELAEVPAEPGEVAGGIRGPDACFC